jgi:hypothetical protein
VLPMIRGKTDNSPRLLELAPLPLPTYCQNLGGIESTAVDSGGREKRRNWLGFKLLEPEVARHQLVRNGRS